MSSTPRLPLPWALLASLALHGLIVGAWSARSSATQAQPAAPPEKDAWAASSVEVGTIASEPSRDSSPSTQVPPGAPAPPEPSTATGVNAAPETPAVPRALSQAKPEDAPPRKTVAPKSAAPAKPALRTPAPARSATSPPAELPQAPAPSASASTALASAAADPISAPSSGSLGAVGLPPGVRHLAKAFARALPEGGHRDRAWSELPLGPVGRAVLTLHVDAEGHLERTEFDPEIPTPAPLKRMIEHALLLLKAGTFSLDKKRVSAGVERLSLDVTLTEEPTDAEPSDAPHLMAKEGHQAPEPDRAGYARFTLNSGRHMEAVLKLLRP